MEMSAEINELTAALVASQGKFQAVAKDKDGYNYKYATLQNIVENTRPYLVENGITVMQFPTNTERSIGVTTLMSHTSGQWVRSAFTMPIQHGTKMSDAQESGKVITYARRYAYAAALGIVVDEDTDARRPPPPPPPPRPAQNKPKQVKKKTVVDPNEALLPNQRKKYHATGKGKYGDEWDDKRPAIALYVSEKRTDKTNELTYDELGEAIKQIKAKKTKPAEQPELIKSNGKPEYA